jgi:hypothetical protein
MLAAVIGLILTSMPLSDKVLADLNSPIYAVRERARDVLRASFVPSDRKQWDALSEDLQREIGHSSKEVFAVCARDDAALPNFSEDLPQGLSTYHLRARLDSSWVLECRFRDDQLQEAKLMVRPDPIKTVPPDSYTGLWLTYRENGDIESQIYYSKGRALGPLTDSPIYPVAPLGEHHAPVPTLPEPEVDYDPKR